MAAQPPRDRESEVSGVRVTRNIRFGSGHVGRGTAGVQSRTRDLLLDVYQPVRDTTNAPLPAIVLAFGGAFHRGSKEDDAFDDGAQRNTPIAEYCRVFAARGYICFSVDYRLTGEMPDPGPRRWLTAPDEISRSRIDHVRDLLGLPPATNRDLADGMEAAFNDVAAAFRFVAENAGKFGVDPDHIAIGGFSAGGTSALYATFACGVPARAVIALSGRMELADIKHYMSKPKPIPILQFVGESDLEYVRELAPHLATQCAQSGIDHTLINVPGAGHFYTRGAKVAGPDGELSSVERVMFDFLGRSSVA